MTDKPDQMRAISASQPRLPPVRVKLRRADAFVAQTYAPDGDSEKWCLRLNNVLGTASPDFVNEAAAPKDEIEGALAVQMACTHTAAMAILGKLVDQI
jgi:hypothetical protein